MPTYRRILLIKPSSLGDIVHTLPVIFALKQRFPESHLTWLVKEQWAGLVERAEGVDRVWPVRPGLSGWLSQVPMLRRGRFDLAIDLQGLFRSAAIGWLSGCRVRVGFANGREGSPWFYTRKVPVPTSEMHAVDRYLIVAEAVGAKRDADAQFRFREPDSDRLQVDALLRQNGLTGTPWIAMQVSARWPTKRWPGSSFAAVADCIQREGWARVALIGGPDERIEAGKVASAMQTAPVDLTGGCAVGLLPALLRRASLLITNDSGPMHVAAAVATPVVALFGPTSPLRTGPYGQGHRVLTNPVPCSPCFSRNCTNDVRLACLTGIDPGAVLTAVRAGMAAKRAQGVS